MNLCINVDSQVNPAATGPVLLTVLGDWALPGEALPAALLGLVPCSLWNKQPLVLPDSSLGSDGDSACPLKERTDGKLI